jgi:PhnB protein
MSLQNPFDLHTITPYLIVSDVKTLIEFLSRIFPVTRRGDIHYRDDGSVRHAEVKIGDSVLMMGEPEGTIKAMRSALYVYVQNCDEAYVKALEAGANPLAPPADYPHGDRYAGIRDPWANIWWLVTHAGKKTD